MIAISVVVILLMVYAVVRGIMTWRRRPRDPSPPTAPRRPPTYPTGTSTRHP